MYVHEERRPVWGAQRRVRRMESWRRSTTQGQAWAGRAGDGGGRLALGVPGGRVSGTAGLVLGRRAEAPAWFVLFRDDGVMLNRADGNLQAARRYARGWPWRRMCGEQVWRLQFGSR